MNETSAPGSPLRRAEFQFFLLDTDRRPDVDLGDGPSVISGDYPRTMDLLSGPWDGVDESFSSNETSMKAVIRDADDLSVRDSPPEKRRRACDCVDQGGVGRDYLSTLTDELLHHIFSFLPTLDVVRTCVLAKRWCKTWRDSWTNSRRLTFSLPPSLRGRLSEFLKIVDGSLNPDAPSKLEKLHLCIPYDRTMRIKLDSWLRTASKRNVEDLSVELIEETYELPDVLYSCFSVVKLSLRRCLFGSVEKIEWPCLSVLTLERVELTDDIMKEIFRGSPALEFLELFSCRGVENIEVNSRNMREMLIGCDSSVAGDLDPHLLVKVSAPYLRVLRLVGDWTAKKVRLLNVSSLVEANLKFLENIHWFDIHSFGTQSSLLRELLEDLKHVHRLTIDHSCLQVWVLLYFQFFTLLLAVYTSFHLSWRLYSKIGLLYWFKRCKSFLICQLMRFFSSWWCSSLSFYQFLRHAKCRLNQYTTRF